MQLRRLKMAGLVFRLLLVTSSAGVGGYALFRVHSADTVPPFFVVYALAGAAMWVAVAAAMLLRRQATNWRQRLGDVIGSLMCVALLVAAGIVLYLLQRSVTVLDTVARKDDTAVVVATAKPFNIYISGIDTYGDIATQARSDVNIVATINPNTRQILVTTIPRDSYVRLILPTGGGMDKLTHAGVYGPEASMKTVAQLLDTNIQGYIRINFTSFVTSIDTLGGVTLDNPVAFSINGEHFPVGRLQLDGKRALLYSRERKSLAHGDVSRGENQQRVIQALIDKLGAVRTLGEFDTVLSLIGTSVDTNMSRDTVRELLKQQLAKDGHWTTEAYILQGRGQTGGLPSYAMPGSRLFMYVLDQASVQTAKQQIRHVLEAKV